MSDPNEQSVSDEMLMALADDELDTEQAEALRARIENDSALSERYAVFTDTAHALRAAFAPDDVPDRLIATATTAPAGPRMPDSRDTGAVVPLRRRIVWPLALAASLLVGIGLGWGLKGPVGPVRTPDLADVARALSAVPTGQSQDVAGFGTARVLGSFETGQGLCRLIAVNRAGAAAGRFVACRDGSDWRVALSVTEGPESGFAPASQAATEVIDIYLDAIGAGPSLDAGAERRVLR